MAFIGPQNIVKFINKKNQRYSKSVQLTATGAHERCKIAPQSYVVRQSDVYLVTSRALLPSGHKVIWPILK